MKKKLLKKIKPSENKNILYTRVPPELYERVREICQETRWSQNLLVNLAITAYTNEFELKASK